MLDWRSQARALPTEITKAESALAAAQRQTAAASDALSREESLRTRLERDIQGHRQKATRYKAQQDTVTTAAQAAAIEHEVQFAESEIDRLEGEEFASLERTEAQEPNLAASRAQVEELAATLEKTRELIAASLQDVTKEQAASMANEKPCARRLTRNGWRALTASAPVAERELPASTTSNARVAAWAFGRRCGINSGRASCFNCDSCGRLLYWDPAMAPAPKTPQPEPAAGAGRAIRKPQQAGE